MGLRLARRADDHMTSLGVQTATGDGEQLFGGFFQVEEVHVIITVAGRAEYLSLTQPRKVMHVGWVGLGHNFAGGASSSGNPSTVTAWKFVEFEDEWWVPRWPANWYFERMFWHLDSSVTVTLEASYP